MIFDTITYLPTHSHTKLSQRELARRLNRAREYESTAEASSGNVGQNM